MRISKKILVLFWIAITISSAQDSILTSGDFEKLIPKLKETYVYVGGGKLEAMRSGYIIWIGVSFEQIKFNKNDSTLVVWGHVFDDARYDKPAITNTQIMIGNFQVNADDSGRAAFTIRETRTLRTSSHFHETFKLNREDYLCFAIAEEKEIDIQTLLNEGKIEKVMQTGCVKLYKVGMLLN